MRLLLLLAVLFVASVAPAQPLGFEGSASGASITTAPDPEGWTSDGGTATVAPSGPLTPTGGFPSQGSQWCVVRSIGAAGGFDVPQGGPAPYPLTPGDTGNVRNSLVIPVAGPGQIVTLSFDFTFVTPECPNGNNGGSTAYNDWFSVDLVDPGSGASLLNLVYRDTWSTELTGGAVSPHEGGAVTTGYCSPPGTLEESAPGAAHVLSVTVPASLQGQTVNFEAHVGDGNDAAFNSWFYLDNLQITGGTPPLGPLTATLANIGGGNYTYTVDAPMTSASGNFYEIYTLISLAPATPTGSGPFLGLNFDAMLASILVLPPFSPPFHFQMTGPTAVFGPFPAAPGLQLDYLAVGIDNSGFPTIAEITAAQAFTF